jgi:thiamine kinase-like enzyme
MKNTLVASEPITSRTENLHDVELITKILSPYLLDEEHIVKIENTTGGITNIVWKLTTSKNRKFALKKYLRIRDFSLAVKLEDFLISHGFTVLKPLNRTMIQQNECFINLYPYIEKAEYIYDDGYENHLLLLLSRLTKFKLRDVQDEDTWLKKCDNDFYFLKKKQTYLFDSTIIEKVLTAYEELRESDVLVEKCVVHSDISPGNILYDGEKYYLIDFDEVRVTSSIYDVVVVLFKHFVSYRKLDEEKASVFINKLVNFDDFGFINRKSLSEMMKFYILKQILEKIYEYESLKTNIFSEQQSQDSVFDWIFYFQNFSSFDQFVCNLEVLNNGI